MSRDDSCLDVSGLRAKGYQVCRSDKVNKCPGNQVSQMNDPLLVSRYRGVVARPPDLRSKDAPEFPATLRPTMPQEPDREEQMWAGVLLNTPHQALFSTQQKSPLLPGDFCREA